MIPADAYGLFAGAVLLGAVHGVEPGHGWPVAASYALDRTNKWLFGALAGLILGLGHLISSIAMVAVFFYAKSYFQLTQVNEPIEVVNGVFIGGPVSVVAGLLLIALGIREYRHGHSHDHSLGGDEDADSEEGLPSLDKAGTAHSHDHPHGHEHDHDHSHGHSHSHEDGGLLARLKGALPFVGGHSHASAPTSDRGLLGIAWFAFLLGFAHEEEFEIIAMCAGSAYCLELMLAYALTVIVGITGLTLALIAGYHRFEERVERLTPYLPVFSAVVLVLMGVGFFLGLF